MVTDDLLLTEVSGSKGIGTNWALVTAPRLLPTVGFGGLQAAFIIETPNPSPLRTGVTWIQAIAAAWELGNLIERFAGGLCVMMKL